MNKFTDRQLTILAAQLKTLMERGINPMLITEIREIHDLVLDEMRAQVESGEIQEFVATSLNADGETQIHVSCLDFPAGVGLYEVGKMMFVHQIQIGNE